MRILTIPGFLVSAVVLASCGIIVPDIKEPWDADKPATDTDPKVSGTALIEFEIKKRIYCDLKDDVQYVNQFPATNLRTGQKELLLPMNWSAQTSLSLQVDETTSLNPGLGLVNTLPNVISYPARTTPLVP
jgi:hypothetical protein